MEPSEAALVANSYRNTAHTRQHISIEGSVAGQGGVAYTAAHSSPTGVVWSRAARNVFFFVDGGVRFSYRCFRDKKQNNRWLNQLPIRTGT